MPTIASRSQLCEKGDQVSRIVPAKNRLVAVSKLQCRQMPAGPSCVKRPGMQRASSVDPKSSERATAALLLHQTICIMMSFKEAVSKGLKCSVTSVDPISWRVASAALLRHQMICMVMFV